MDLKSPLAFVSSALLAAALLPATASGLTQPLEDALPEGVLRLDISVVDGVATPTLTGAAAGELAVECLDDTTDTLAAGVLCLVDFAASGIICYEVGVYLDVYSGYVTLTSACPDLSASCGTSVHCEASNEGRSRGPWTCTAETQGSASFSGYCYLIYSEDNGDA